MDDHSSRRAFVGTGLTGLLGALAGCTGDSDSQATDATPTTTDAPETETQTATQTTTEPAERIEITGGHPTYGYSATRDHHGRAQEPLATERSLRHVWSQAEHFSEQPAVADGTVYLPGADGTFFALDATTGEERWSVTTDFYLDATPTVAGEYVYLPTGSNKIRCFRRADGQPIWDAEYGSSVDVPVAVVDDVVVARADQLTGLSVERGEALWTLEDNGDRWDDAEAYNCTPAVADGTVYIPGREGINVVDAATGERKPTISMPEEYSGTAGSIVRGGDVIQPLGVESYPGKVNSTIEAYGVGVYSPSDGRKWLKPDISKEGAAVAVVDAEHVYVYVPDRGLLALAREDGSVVWETEQWGQPVMVGEGDSRQLVFASRKTEYITELSSFTPHGERLWSKELEFGVSARPVVVDQSLLLSGGGGSYTFTLQDGRLPS